MEQTLRNAEIALKKIRDYKLHDEAFEQEGVMPRWKELRYLPPAYVQRYAKLVIDEYFNIMSPGA